MNGRLRLCDTHAHLSDPAFDEDRVVVVQESVAELEFLIDVGTTPETWGKVRALAGSVERCFGTVGWHPHDAHRVDMASLDAQLDEAWFDKAVAIGEIGLDFHYDFSPRPVQCEVFEAQLTYAAAHRRPVVIHVREAWPDALVILRRVPLDAGGVVHCFTGTYPEARTVLDLGLHLSFTGVIAFPRSTDLRAVLAKLPVERLFFETDSPYLAPPPHRGERNHPAWVRHVVEAAATTLALPLPDLVDMTTMTARRLFGITDCRPGGA